MLDFSSLDKLVKKDIKKPSNIEFIYFLFFKEGIDFIRFNELPIPYIMSILSVADYKRKIEDRELSKSKFRK